MQNGGWADLLRLIPENLHDRLVLMTADGSEVAVQDFIRLEREYLVLRGRVAGTSDTGLAFFIPYDRIVFARFYKPVPEDVVYGLYGLTPPERKPVEGPQEAKEEKPPEPAEAAPAAPAGNVNRKELLQLLRNRVHQTGSAKPPPPRGSPEER